MLRTPAGFTHLQRPQDPGEAPLNMLFRGDSLLVREDDHALPDDALALALAPEAAASWHAVGLLGGRYCRTTWLPSDTPAPEGWRWNKLRPLFGKMPDELVALAGRSWQVAEWDRTHRFCGACATPTVRLEHERCARCPACGHMAYPRISPAMMVLVRRGEHILLARHLNSPTGFFTALAGFLEAGESIEEAIHREVREEVGLEVRDLRYFASQSWPFPHSLMIAYTAEYAGGDIVLDATEIAEARWFGPEDGLPPVPPLGLSIAGHLIHANLPGAPG